MGKLFLKYGSLFGKVYEKFGERESMPSLFKSDAEQELLLKQEQNRYVITDRRNKTVMFYVESKLVTTKGEFQFRTGNNVYVGKLLKNYPILRSYTLIGSKEDKVAQIEFIKSEQIGTDVVLQIGNKSLSAKTIDAGKSFDFKGMGGHIVFTIDKRTFDFKDSFVIKAYETFDPFILSGLGIAIDDFFHP